MPIEMYGETWFVGLLISSHAVLYNYGWMRNGARCSAAVESR